MNHEPQQLQNLHITPANNLGSTLLPKTHGSKSKTAIKTNYTSQNNIPLKKKESQEKRQFKDIKEVGRKSKKLQINRLAADQCLYQNQSALMGFYRYAPITVIAACGMKDDFMKSLNDRGDFSPLEPKIKKKKGMQPVWQKLTKLAMLKGKYKYRQKFNFMYSAQLKAINYKRKQYKKKKDSSSSQEDDDKKQKFRDLQTLKKSMGVEDCKVFIIKGNYRDLKNALLERGWVQNSDRHSNLYDLKWTTKVSDVNFEGLRPHQLVNHFNNNACLTSKYGLIKSLRSIMLSQSIDVDRFFPKCFDMSDIQDFENFHQIYRWVYAVSIIKNAITSDEEEPKDILRVTVALIVTLRKMFPAEKILSAIAMSRYHLCSIEEWKYLSKTKGAEVPKSSLLEWELTNITWQRLKLKINTTLQLIDQIDPQSFMDGSANIWIVKPAFLSRGRGIRCLNQLSEILDYSLGKDTQYVIQKYIENPLLINNRKFDIRQWVIVEDYNPPRIWYYGQFYVRFCLEDYNAKKLNNRFIHLTNNSIQKNNHKVNSQTLGKESMWTMEQLKEFLQTSHGEGCMKDIVAKFKEIVVATILATQDQVYGRKRSFQLIGYDFMIDDRLNPWLIEINSSPAMDYSTPVTRRLVKMVSEDTVKVMIDPYKKKAKKKGLFRLIYDGESPYDFKRYHKDQKSTK